METKGLHVFLKALLAKHFKGGTAELLTRFVNRRRGDPHFSDDWELRPFFDVEKKCHGYSCGAKPLIAFASQRLSDAEIALYERVKRENRMHS